MDGALERVRIGKSLVDKLICLEVVLDAFDIVQFRRIFRQPLDGEPVRAGSQRRERKLAGVYWSVVLDQHHRFDRLPRLRSIEPVQLLKMSDEVAAALAAAGVHDKPASHVIKRPEHGDLPCLSRRGHAQIGTCLCPGTGEIGMRQRLALIAVEQNDVAGFGLLPAQVQTQTDAFDLGGNLTALQRVPWTPPTTFFCAGPSSYPFTSTTVS